MVNDFGALDIDADLLESATEDTITLANGCVCCTMGTELLYALSDALDRRPRPDWLVIEASGVADPRKIATAAHAEQEMTYQGVVVMADSASLAERLSDPLIGAQVAEQIRAADLLLATRTDIAPLDALREIIAPLSAAPLVEAPHGRAPVDLLLDPPAGAKPPEGGGGHDHGAAYASWSTSGGAVTEAGLRALLADPPAGLYRFKGLIRLEDEAVEAQLVGRSWSLKPTEAGETRAVAIGPAPLFDPAAFQAAWAAIAA